jgi:hypothetical protein
VIWRDLYFSLGRMSSSNIVFNSCLDKERQSVCRATFNSWAIGPLVQSPERKNARAFFKSASVSDFGLPPRRADTQNALAKTLREIGRLERTLFTLDWSSDPVFLCRS